MKLVVRRSCGLADLLLDKAHVSRTRIRKWIQHGAIHVDGQIATRLDLPLMPGQSVEINRVARAAPFPVLYEDPYLIAAEKPAGMLSIGTDKEISNTFYRIVNQYVRTRSHGKERIFIVHRLDREASGVMLFAKTQNIQQVLQKAWGDTEKLYCALVEGCPPEKNGTVTSWLKESRAYVVHSSREDASTKLAITHYRLLKRFPRHCLLEIRLETGRKNQIRVHLSELGCPIAGDKKYGASANPIHRLALHAFFLSFNHPVTGERMSLTTPVPEVFTSPSITS